MLSFGRRNSKDGVVEAGPASMKAVDLGIKDGRDGKDEGQSSSPIVIRRDAHGFFLEERSGITEANYARFEALYLPKQERQRERWDKITLLAKDGLRLPMANERVKIALRKGLPRELRPIAWLSYSGAEACMSSSPMRYLEMARYVQSGMLQNELAQQIEADVPRAFANNRQFRQLIPHNPLGLAWNNPSVDEPPIHGSLRRVIGSIMVHLPLLEYRPTLSILAATCLLVTVDEESSFWILERLLSRCDSRHTAEPKQKAHAYSGFYIDDVTMEPEVLLALLEWKLPAVHRHLKHHEISLAVVTAPWFQTLFVGHLPFEGALRVWDALMLEGVKVIFRVALALFKVNEVRLLAVKDSFALASMVRNLPKLQLDVVQLMDEAFSRTCSFSANWLTQQRDKIAPIHSARQAVRRWSKGAGLNCSSPFEDQEPRSNSRVSNRRLCAPVVVANATADECTSEQLFNGFTIISIAEDEDAIGQRSTISFERPSVIDGSREGSLSGASASSSLKSLKFWER